MSPTPAPKQRRLRGADDRLLRGYAPLVLIVVLFLALALAAPTVAPEQNVAATGELVGEQGGGGTAGGSAAGAGTGSATTVAGGAGGSGTGGATGAGGGAAGGATPPAATACPGRQVPTDPYAPPCAQWSGGDNGGATSMGVTAKEITVTYRNAGMPDVGSVVSQLTQGKVDVSNTSAADVLRTYQVLAEYFNKHFQFYGRKIVIKSFKGQGDLTSEVLGGGQATAAADGVKVSTELHAFADVTGMTQPYAEALAAHKVIALGGLYFSKPWYEQHAPYAYSVLPDCTTVADAVADFAVKEMAGKPAKYAGGDLQGKPRKIGVVAPNNAIYQSCENEAVAKAKKAGLNIADVETYPLSLDSLSNSAATFVNKFKGEGITTVVLASDPIMPFFMTTKAAQQNWTPEWVIAGTAYEDTDFVGQLMQADEWKHAFGVSFLAKQLPERASLGYAAYKSISPSTSPAGLLVETIYYQLEMLAIGIQEAGPNLTPQTFEQGLRRYPGGTGEVGTWGFPAGNYTPTRDGRIVWWDPKATSTYNGRPGAYLDNGKRYPIGQYPRGAPPIFLNGGP